MPKSKLRVNRGGHALAKGKGSVYQRTAVKQADRRETRANGDLEAYSPLALEMSSAPEASA
jgi:hypothetical protein